MNYIETQITASATLEITNFLPKIGLEEVRKEIAAGLMASHKYISSKYFYDDKGSCLFDKITSLEEYYPTRTEISILHKVSSFLANKLQDFSIIELGSGNASKISILFKKIPPNKLASLTYIPVDVSDSAIELSTQQLHVKYPDIRIEPMIADFVHQLHLLPAKEKRLICFFGSTIGNFTREQSLQFLTKLSSLMTLNDELLLGFDMVKNKKILENAYNDSKLVTEAFNKNILEVVNNLLATDFNPDNFEHYAFFNEQVSRIEMHLIATKNMVINSPHLDEKIILKKGESIHTENSHKFTEKQILALARQSGLTIKNIFKDDKEWFSIYHLSK